METKSLYSFGPFRIDSAKRLLERDQQAIPLPTKAFETLLFLIRNRDRLVKKEELMSALWPDTAVEENNLSQSISAVRKALGDSPQAPQYIATVPGWGYRFAAPVLILDEKFTSSPPARIPPSEKWHPDRRVPPRVLAFSMSLLMLVAAAFLFFRGRQQPQAKKVARTAPAFSRRSVAVLGFDNLSEDKRDAWLSTALAEMLNTELAAGGTLRVVSGADVARANTDLGPSRAKTPAGHRLEGFDQQVGSDLLIYGSYLAVGVRNRRQLRLDIRLKNAKSGEMIDEIAETGAANDLFDLVSRVGLRLRQKLGVAALSPTENLAVRDSLPANTEAAEAYAEGLAKLRIFDAVGARNKFQESIAFDPKYPMGHSGLADAWSKLGYDSKVVEEARIAFQLSSNLSSEEKLLVEGRYRSAVHEWPRAVEIFNILARMFPDNLDYGLRLADSQTESSDAKGALKTLDGLRSLPPPLGQDPRIGIAASTAWHSLGDFGQMKGALEEAIANAQVSGHRLLLASARSRQCFVWRFQGDSQRALDACREAQQIYTEARDRGGQADTLRLLGDVLSASDVRLALNSYEKALAIEKETGNIWGTATVMNQMAILYSDQGKHVAAENSFQQVLKICRVLGKKVSATGMMINIGSELAAQGKLNRSRVIDEETFRAAEELGNKDIQGLAANDIAAIDQLHGQLNKAQRGFEQARSLLDSADDRSHTTVSITGLGEIAMAKGDFDTAQKLFAAALETRRSAGETIPAAESQLNLATLSFEKGESSTSLSGVVWGLIRVFSSEKASNDESAATALLARIATAHGQNEEALMAAERAIEVSAKASPNYRLSSIIVATPIRVANRRITVAQAIANLEKAILEAREFGYVGTEMEAMLALGELQVKSGSIARGRAQLEHLRKHAGHYGFTGLTAKASSLISNGR